jgi:uncharacterized membrane protein
MSDQAPEEDKIISRESELSGLEDELQKVDPELLQELSPEERLRVLTAVQSMVISHSIHSGPLPAPETLREYNVIIPDGANRIMALTEQQSNHRMYLEKTVVLSNSRESTRGQLFGFIIALVGILCAAALIFSGKETAGSILFGTTLVGMVTVFVIGKKAQTPSGKED